MKKSREINIYNIQVRDFIKRLWESKKINEGSHGGLLLDKYYYEERKKEKSTNELLEGIKGSVKNINIYKNVYKRWENYIKHEIKATYKIFGVKGRLVLGVGYSSPLEIYLSFHRTYGVPYIPGTSIKGLALHYFKTMFPENENKEKYIKILFGKQTQNDKSLASQINEEDAEKGYIRYFDALITPDTLQNSIDLDIINVHHQEYYTHKGKKPPSDMDSPVPIKFITVKGNFLIAVKSETQDEESKKWEVFALSIISSALRNWGIGAKTSLGYGRMEEIK